MKGKEKTAEAARESVLGPVQRKTPKASLSYFFEQQFPNMGEISRGAVVENLIELLDELYPRNDHIKMGQMPWYAVDKNETSSYGKLIEKCRIKPILLDVITENDIINAIGGMKKKEVKKNIEVRLFKQSYNQETALSCADVGTILNLSPATISNHIREYERETNEVVPRRGTIHDIGPSLTHKKKICYKVIVEGKSIEQTAKETNHSPEAITRYVKDYKRISACLAQGLPDNVIPYVTRTSKKLVEEYKALIAENNIDLCKEIDTLDYILY